MHRNGTVPFFLLAPVNLAATPTALAWVGLHCDVCDVWEVLEPFCVNAQICNMIPVLNTSSRKLRCGRLQEEPKTKMH
ncbi:hypothetical protein PF008_g3714 [Phytophthora fragariae]|uniref:Secreted protein n=2 Tax=Phytophthora TaxID=4783 RepID=A0A6A3NLG1_9STRA|nr:hypothetical protein PR002_g3909 [Phytophthora rubi]KAE9356207.1 hypothetical protein PF008_g3714 [Phytophthora fragariae]